jgi:hypothetical protein
MAKIHKEQLKQASQAVKLGSALDYAETASMSPKGRFILEMRDAKTGRVLEFWEKDNVITKDAGIMAARLFKDNKESRNGLRMLAVGTGASGELLNPDAPDDRQRHLNSEIARKTFSGTTFRNEEGVAVNYPTNIVDFTTTFGEAEAVGPLNEMGLICPVSDSPYELRPNPDSFPHRDTTRDIRQYDVLINYLTFSVISKPSSAVLSITWRLTF